MIALLLGLLLNAGSANAADAAVKPPVEIYGYAKLDLAWDDSRMSTGNFARWVEAEDVNRNDSQFSLTANESRLGIRINGPELGGAKSRGLMEADFYGGGVENKAVPMMRHAYAEVSWPAWDFAFLGGQTWDVQGPLNPPTLNVNVLWGAGNIGYRRPQLRMTKGVEVAGSRIELAVAAVRTIAQSTTFFTGDTGADAGFPSGEARLAVTFPACKGQKATIGVGGHLGQEEWDKAKYGLPRYFRTWSAVVDLLLPVCEKLQLKGEGWMGENLSAYNCGIYQGLDGLGSGSLLKWEETAKLVDTIRSKGAWASLTAGPYKYWKYAIGAGIDDPDNRDLKYAGDKTRNRTVFGTITYDITSSTTVGVEVSDWVTEYYAKARNAEALRVQASLIQRF